MHSQTQKALRKIHFRFILKEACEAIFLFYYNANSETIVYDYGYRILRPSSGIGCMSGSFEEIVKMNDGDNNPSDRDYGTSTEPYTDSSISDDYYSSSSSSPTVVVNTTEVTATTLTTLPLQRDVPMELTHHIMLMSSMETG